MGRLTQALAFIELPTEEFTGLWKKGNMTKISGKNPELIKLRKQRLKEKELLEKSSQKE